MILRNWNVLKKYSKIPVYKNSKLQVVIFNSYKNTKQGRREEAGEHMSFQKDNSTILTKDSVLLQVFNEF